MKYEFENDNIIITFLAFNLFMNTVFTYDKDHSYKD